MNADLNMITWNLKSIVTANTITYDGLLNYADKLLHLFLIGRIKIKYDAGDIVHSIIEKLYIGSRKWDYEKYPDFKRYFYLLIKSEISNLAKYEEKFAEIDDGTEEGEDRVEEFLDFARNLSLEEILSGQDAKELKERCLKLLDGDDDAVLVFLESLEGNGNAGIAESLGVELSLVENAKKRMKRRLNLIYLEYFGRRGKSDKVTR